MPSANVIWLGDARWRLARPICGTYGKHFSLDGRPPSAGSLRVFSASTCACGTVQANRIHARQNKYRRLLHLAMTGLQQSILE